MTNRILKESVGEISSCSCRWNKSVGMMVICTVIVQQKLIVVVERAAGSFSTVDTQFQRD
jgi:hypothetical protein